MADKPAWEEQASGVTSRLRGVSAASEMVTWASGADGTIIRTGDGGRTWRKREIPGTGSLDFRDIDAIDERTAFAMSIGPGEASRIYHTGDGGLNWDLRFQNTDPKAFYDAMAFWPSGRGIALSDSADGRFIIRLSEEGGRNWTLVSEDALPNALTGEGAFAASGTNIAVFGKNHAWIGFGSGRVLRSENGGRAWAVSDTGLRASPTSGIFSIAFRDARHGIVTGGDYAQDRRMGDNAAITSDGGKTWRLVPGLGGLRSAVSYLNGTNGRMLLAAGPSGTDLSTDDGQTWTAAPGPGYHAFGASPRARLGWGVGEGGRVGLFRW